MLLLLFGRGLGIVDHLQCRLAQFKLVADSAIVASCSSILRCAIRNSVNRIAFTCSLRTLLRFAFFGVTVGHIAGAACASVIGCEVAPRRARSLRFYHHHCAEVGDVIKLARFPIRHPDASV